MPELGYPIPGNPWSPTMAPLAPPAYMPMPMKGGDPGALAMMMFGMPLIQRMAGPGNFLANMVPGQQLADQMLAAQYQKTTLGATQAMSEAGNAAAAKKVQAMATLAVGGGPSPLNEAQAANIAGMINHPIGKMVLGQLMGPDRLEGLMFGRNGDPQALAAAVNRTGFFRKDTLGGERMSQESLEDFSKSVHANLYGPPPELMEEMSRKQAHADLMKRDDYAKMTKDAQEVELKKALPEYREQIKARSHEMHGFMGGQTGQMMDYLFQRGALPQSIGALSPAERVKAVAAGPRDEETMQRLTRDFAQRELMRTDEAFAKAAPEERETILKKNLPTYRSRLDKTFEEVDKVRNNDPRAASAGEIEKLGGYDVAARNVDASKTADKLKKFGGAVAAVREIFGDSGNPNAPMPQLLAALEHLSQGTMNQIGPGKVESTLRQMRTAARDAGIGFEQLAGISAQTSAYGDTLGISRPTSLQNTLNAVQMTKVMRDSGMFNQQVYGGLSQAEASQEVAMRLQRGAASGVNKTMSAIARAVETNPELYKNAPGSEMLQKMVEAYRSGNNNFEVGGKKFNLAEIAGTGGGQALTKLFSEGGGDVATLRALAIDPTTARYSRESFGFEAQKYQVQRDIARNTIEGEVVNKLTTNDFKAVAAGLGLGSNAQKSAFSKDLSFSLAKAIQEETAMMSDDERVKHMQDRAPEIIKSLLMEKQGIDAAAAETRAKQIMPHVFGDTEAKQRDTMQRITANASAFTSRETGLQLPGLAIYNQAEQFTREKRVSENRARRSAAMVGGSETTLEQRLGEELDRIAETGEVDVQRFITRGLGNVIDKAAARDKYAPELSAGFASILKDYSKIVVNAKEVDTASKAAAGGDAAAKQQLKALAGADADVTVVDQKQIAERLKAKDAKEVAALYAERVKGGTAKDTASQIDALSKTYDAGTIPGLLDPSKKEKTVQELTQLGRERIGGARGATAEERATNEREMQRLQNAMAAAQHGGQQVAIEDSARALADKAIEERKLGDKEASTLRDQYKAAAMGDTAAYDAITAAATGAEKERMPQLELLRNARGMYDKEGVELSDSGTETRLGEGLEAQAAAAVEERKARDAKTAAERGSKPPDEKTPAADKPAAPSETKLTEASFKAERVELVAANVTMAATADKTASVGREAAVNALASNATAEAARVPSTPPPMAGGGGTQEMTINGTLNVRGMREAVITMIGEQPMETPNGAPIMDPHVAPQLGLS